MDGRTDGFSGGRMDLGDEFVCGWLDFCVGEWMNECVDGWRDRWMGSIQSSIGQDDGWV